MVMIPYSTSYIIVEFLHVVAFSSTEACNDGGSPAIGSETAMVVLATVAASDTLTAYFMIMFMFCC